MKIEMCYIRVVQFVKSPATMCTCNVDSTSGKLNLYFSLNLIKENKNLNSHIWLVATVLDSVALNSLGPIVISVTFYAFTFCPVLIYTGFFAVLQTCLALTAFILFPLDM